MLREAGKTLGLGAAHDHLLVADAASLPFASDTFDLVTCKLAFHYFPEPEPTIKEMVRVRRRSGMIALIDRVASNDPEQQAAQNRLEKVRTPSKVRVYAESEVTGLLQSAGLTVVHRSLL